MNIKQCCEQLPNTSYWFEIAKDNGVLPYKITYNFIDDNGNRVFEDGFDEMRDFDINGISLIKKKIDGKPKWNGVNKYGEYVFNEWFDYITKYNNGYYCIELNKKYNFITPRNEMLFKKWINNSMFYNFHNEYVIVKNKDGKSNYMDKKGNYLLNNEREGLWNYNLKYNVFRENNKWNYIDNKENIVFDIWFEKAREYSNGYFAVKTNDEWNLIDINNKTLFNEWYDEIYPFDSEEYARVYNRNTGINFVNINNEFLLDKPVKASSCFQNGVASIALQNPNGGDCCILDDEYNFINNKGEFLLPSNVPWNSFHIDYNNNKYYAKVNDKWKQYNRHGIVK